MVYIIIIIVVLGIISFIFNIIESIVDGLSDAVGSVALGITVLCSIVAFFAYSWQGVLAVVIVGLGVSFGLKQIGKAISEHDKKRRETAEINKKTNQDNRIHNNELALRQELDKNCRWLGEMTSEKWRKKLGNFISKDYESSFDIITDNFAKQMEEQNIIQNDDWFAPFLEHIVKGNGKTVIQLLNEVSCPQLNITHKTPNGELLERMLEQCTRRKSDDVPALLENKLGVYYPTKYALKRFGLLERAIPQGEIIEDDDL